MMMQSVSSLTVLTVAVYGASIEQVNETPIQLTCNKFWNSFPVSCMNGGSPALNDNVCYSETSDKVTEQDVCSSKCCVVPTTTTTSAVTPTETPIELTCNEFWNRFPVSCMNGGSPALNDNVCYSETSDKVTEQDVCSNKCCAVPTTTTTSTVTPTETPIELTCNVFWNSFPVSCMNGGSPALNNDVCYSETGAKVTEQDVCSNKCCVVPTTTTTSTVTPTETPIELTCNEFWNRFPVSCMNGGSPALNNNVCYSETSDKVTEQDVCSNKCCVVPTTTTTSTVTPTETPIELTCNVFWNSFPVSCMNGGSPALNNDVCYSETGAKVTEQDVCSNKCCVVATSTTTETATLIPTTTASQHTTTAHPAQWQCYHNQNYNGGESDVGYTDKYCTFSYCLNGSDPTALPARGCYYDNFTPKSTKNNKQCLCYKN
eukprot:Pgem_evm2s10347